jgi:alpha-ketoglutaric semialdehyde dehydrogenase
MSALRSFVGGTWRDGGRLSRDLNPARPSEAVSDVLTNDLTRALRFADDIHAGVVKVNQESAGLEFHVPFGGMQESSSGSREQGKVAREFFTQWKTVYIDRLPS